MKIEPLKMLDENLQESTDDLVVIYLKGYPEWKVKAFPNGEIHIINLKSEDIIAIQSDDFALSFILGISRIGSKRFKGNPNWKKLELVTRSFEGEE